MSFLFPKPSPPVYQAPAEAAPPPPAPPPPPPNPASPPVQTAASSQQRAARAAASGGVPGSNYSGTLLTGPQGAPEAKTAKSTLGSG